MTELTSSAHEIVKNRYFWKGEDKWSDLVERISSENAKNEANRQDKWKDKFESIIEPMEFIPAGRILRNLGRRYSATSNCNFLPIEDTIESIFDTLKYYGIISAYGGGSGINFSALRPKGTPIVSRGGISSGMISFMEMFDFCGRRLETGGQRRAAGIGICDISHPEVLDFINAKVQHNKLNQFNISVGVNSDFLKSVQRNDTWDLKFAGKIYDTIPAQDLWFKILNNMINHAEPGFLNWDNLKKNNTFYFAPIIGVNPCGEIPLEAWGVCNLGSLVLPKFISNKNTNWQKLRDVIRIAIRFMDNVIDLAYYPIPQQNIVVKNSRRIGLGTMGLADYLFIKQIRYGSEKSIQEIEKLYKFIRDEVYFASVDIAREKGAFPKFDRIEYGSASFIRKLPVKLRMYIKEHAIRNATLLTVAPTGTTSMIPEVISGIEPLPFKGYKRVDGLGERTYINKFCNEHYDDDWFVDSYDLKPEEHLEVQSVIQKYTDGSISKTIILPETTTVEDLSDILMEYIFDLKGVTVYRDKSREKQVYYRLTREEIKECINNKNVSNELSEEDVQCSSGTCEM